MSVNGKIRGSGIKPHYPSELAGAMRMRWIRLDGFRPWRHFYFSKLCNQMSTFPTPSTGWSTWCLQSQKPGAVFVSLLSLGAEMLRLQDVLSFSLGMKARMWYSTLGLSSSYILHDQCSWTYATFQRQQPVKCLSGACLNQHVVHGKLPFLLWFLRGDVKLVYTWKCSRNSCADI